MNKKISVIVPIYNMEQYLERCITSICEQTYANLEIILVNDGSTDGSKAICEEYQKKDRRIKIYNKQNGGLSDAKNYGIQKSTGEYIAFVDADDWIDLDAYSVMSAEMSRTSADIVICGRYLEYENGNSKEWHYPQRMTMNNREALIRLNSFYNFDMSSCDKLYRKNLFSKISFPFGKKCEDAFTTYKLFAISGTITYIPNCFYHYYQRNNSISRSQTVNMDYIYAAKDQLQFIKENFPDIKNVGETNVAYSIKNLYEESILKSIPIADDLKKEKKSARIYAKNVLANKYISCGKKIKYVIYEYCFLLYKIIIAIKAIRERGNE